MNKFFPSFPVASELFPALLRFPSPKRIVSELHRAAGTAARLAATRRIASLTQNSFIFFQSFLEPDHVFGYPADFVLPEDRHDPMDQLPVCRFDPL